MSSPVDPVLLEPQVLALCERYRFEEPHSRRVAAMAHQLFELLRPLHGLGDAEATLLRHAARKRPRAMPRGMGADRVRAVAVLSAILRLADGLERERTGRAVIRGCEIEKQGIVLVIEGVNLEGEGARLKEKASMVKPVFGRPLVWRRYAPEPLPEAEVPAGKGAGEA